MPPKPSPPNVIMDHLGSGSVTLIDDENSHISRVDKGQRNQGRANCPRGMFRLLLYELIFVLQCPLLSLFFFSLSSTSILLHVPFQDSKTSS